MSCSRRSLLAVAIVGMLAMLAGSYACSSFGTAPGPNDAAVNVEGSSAEVDAGEDARPSCVGPFDFDEVVKWAPIDTQSARFGKDGRVYTSIKKPGPTFDLEMWIEDRKDGGATPDHAKVLAVNTPGTETHATFFDDERAIAFELSAGGGREGIAIARRASVDEAFDTPTALTLSDAGSNAKVEEPYVVGSHIYFAYQHVVSGNEEIMAGEIAGSEIQSMVPIAALAHPAIDGHPVVTRDERTLYFSSERAGATSGSQANVWVSTRPTSKAEFGAPTPLESSVVNTTDYERPTWISDDECTLYYLRQGGDQKMTLRRASRKQ